MDEKTMQLVALFFEKNIPFTSTEEAMYDLVCRFLSSLYKNGNILTYPAFSRSSETTFVSYTRIPEADALKDEYMGLEGLSQKDALQSLGVNISYTIMGPLISDAPLRVETSLEKVNFLFLYPPGGIGESERQLVLRTNEGNYLPLYRWPHQEDPYLNEHLTHWVNHYEAMMVLWLASYQELEATVARQFSTLESDFSLQGIDIAKRIKKRLKKNLFYPIAEIQDGELAYVRADYAKCPSCLKGWSLQKPFLDRFTFKCDACLLVGYDLMCF